MMDKNEDGNGLLMKHRGTLYYSLFNMRLHRCLVQVRDNNGAGRGIKVALDANVLAMLKSLLLIIKHQQ